VKLVTVQVILAALAGNHAADRRLTRPETSVLSGERLTVVWPVNPRSKMNQP